MVSDDEIINYFYSRNGEGRFCPKRLEQLNNDEIKHYLEQRYKDSSSLLETIYRIHDNLETRPSCKICNGYVKFNTLHNTFDDTCCKECGNKYRHLQKTKSIKEKYGVENAYQSEEIKERIKKIKLEKYGDEHYRNDEKIIKTCLEKYGVTNPGASEQVKEHNKKYFLKKYGEITPAKVKEVKEKSKQTCLEKYGFEYSHQNLLVRQKTSETMRNKSDEEKRIIYNKAFETAKRNKTINYSKPEEYSYNILKEKFNDVIRQYRDKERYPYFCDFYIPSLDTFIECQYAMFHHGRPYKGDENDLKEVELIKEKSEKRKQETGKSISRYDGVIKVWTITDPQKRQCAKEHNLNYLEFFTILELENWLKDIN